MVFHHGVTFGLVTSIMTNCHTFVNSKNKRTKIKHLDSASSKRNFTRNNSNMVLKSILAENQRNFSGIREVGKGSWKEREVGKF